jgi:fructose-1,6-bisphosphatase/inositol monophosphatase family enzyme
MGKIEGRIVYDGFGKDYDFAAGTLLVSEAGGVVKNFGSDKYDYKNLNFIAGNRNTYEVLTGEDGITKLVA